MDFIKKFCLLFVFFLAHAAIASDLVVVETNPRDPIRGEVFQIIFKCSINANEEPKINFRADGFDILGKHVQGVSAKTIFQNGRLTTERKMLVVYEAKADRAGRVALRDVVVDVGGQIVREPEVPIEVLEARREPKVVFLEAEVPKRSVFLGEGVTVRYYIYTKVNLQSFDIKKYPKLDGFMKRYLQEGENPQNVNYNGEVFRRSLIYAARLYPEKTGTLVVDPMEISSTYSIDPFGNLGFGFGGGGRDAKSRVIVSEPVQIKVNPLPPGKPSNFSGLVGKHKFELSFSRSNLLVNEPMEVRFTVSGNGNLENFENPIILDSSEVEKFDAKSDLTLMGAENAIKKIDYTYLGKKPGVIKPSRFEISYFDTDTNRYESFAQDIPQIVVAGGGAQTKQEDIEDEAKKSDAPEKLEIDVQENSTGVIAAGSLPWWQQTSFWWSVLGLVSVGVMISIRQKFDFTRNDSAEWKKDVALLRGSEVTVSSLIRAISHLATNERERPVDIISGSKLSDEAKRYFIQLLDEMSRREYAQGTYAEKPKVQKKYLKELTKNLREKYARP